jgi:tetratricopeptide (TPR) repeat protein
MEESAPADVTSTATEGTATAASAEPASGPPVVPSGAITQEKPYEVMAKAREAFWLRDFELAEQQYRKLTQLDPDNPDGYGEMGNMYFSQGKWDESAEAYYQAGVRLVNEGFVEQAQQLVGVIRGLNNPRADDLEAHIDAAESASSP